MKTRYIEKKELLALREVLSDKEWLPFAVMLETGLRIGDVLALRPWDVHGGAVRYRAQKTGKAGLSLISKDLEAALLRSSAGAWVFPSPKDPEKHLTRQAAWARMKRAAEKAGVEARGVAPHSWRKNFAVELLRCATLAEVAEALQHERTDTTEIYALADWTSGENAELPLKRKDLARIVEEILRLIGYRVDK